MQDLSGAGKSVLSDRVPNSGSVDRALQFAAFIASPVAAPAAAVGSLAYTPPVQNALRALVSRRPDAAPRVANKLREIVEAGGVVTVPMVEALALER